MSTHTVTCRAGTGLTSRVKSGKEATEAPGVACWLAARLRRRGLSDYRNLSYRTIALLNCVSAAELVRGLVNRKQDMK